MTDPLQQLRFEALKEFWKHSTGRFDQRRAYEWRMCFAVWTAFAAFAVGVLSRKLPIDWWIVGGIAFIGILFCLLHLYFLRHLHRRNNSDRLQAYAYAAEMRSVADVQLPSELKTKIQQHKKDLESNKLSWSHKTQVAFTILLYLAVVGVAFNSGSEDQQSSVDKSGVTSSTEESPARGEGDLVR